MIVNYSNFHNAIRASVELLHLYHIVYDPYITLSDTIHTLNSFLLLLHLVILRTMQLDLHRIVGPVAHIALGPIVA